jgi:hypothetical protein
LLLLVVRMLLRVLLLDAEATICDEAGNLLMVTQLGVLSFESIHEENNDDEEEEEEEEEEEDHTIENLE